MRKNVGGIGQFGEMRREMREIEVEVEWERG